MATRKSAIDAFKRAVYRQRFAGRRKMYTGRVLEDGSIVMAGAPANRTWVRSSYAAREQVSARGLYTTPNVPVWVEKNASGELEIVGFDWVEGTAKFGAAFSAVIQPPIQGDITGLTVPALGITEGWLVPSTLGGLYVHTGAFTYDGGVHPGYYTNLDASTDETYYDASVAAYVPSTIGQQRWVGRYFDFGDSGFHFTAGTPVNTDFLDESLLGELVLTPRAIPLGAVCLTYGMTTVSGARFASWRYFLGQHQPQGWKLTADTTLPAGHDVTVVGSVDVGDYSLTVDGSLFIL